MGVDATDYPVTYRQLENKVESIREVYEALWRITKQALRSDHYGNKTLA